MLEVKALLPVSLWTEPLSYLLSFGIRRRVIQNGKISETLNSETRSKTKEESGTTSTQVRLNDDWLGPRARQRFSLSHSEEMQGFNSAD